MTVLTVLQMKMKTRMVKKRRSLKRRGRRPRMRMKGMKPMIMIWMEPPRCRVSI